MPAILRHETPKLVVPVRLSAWLSGDIGRCIEGSLRQHLNGLAEVALTRLPRGIVVSTSTPADRALEAVVRAAQAMEADVERAFPWLHHDMGPVWDGVVTVVYPREPVNGH